MAEKLILVILDGLPWRNFRRFMGNLEGWVENGEAKVWKIRAVLPSTSASCYASIHTGVTPQVHKVTSNDTLFRVKQPDIFSQARTAGKKTAAVTHSYFSIFFQRAPFDPIRDLEIDDESLPIQHGRFHSMAGYSSLNYMTPSDGDLFATLSMLIDRNQIDYGILHSLTVDSMGHMYGPDSPQMEKILFQLDAQLAPFITRWRDQGYEVIVTADHGQNTNGHHGGNDEQQRDTALYYFGTGIGPKVDQTLCQLQIAPTVLSRLGAEIPATMTAKTFLD